MQPLSNQFRELAVQEQGPFARLPEELNAHIAGFVADETDFFGKPIFREIPFPYFRIAKSFCTLAVKTEFFRLRGSIVNHFHRDGLDKFLSFIPQYVKEACEFLDLYSSSQEAVVAFPNLQKLKSVWYDISFSNLSKLKELHLSFIGFQNHLLITNFPASLEKFSSHGVVFDVEHSKCLASCLKLSSLELFHCKKISLQALQNLSSLPLHNLNLLGSTLSDQHIEVISSFREIQRLSLERCTGFSIEALSCLEKLPKLQKIVIDVRLRPDSLQIIQKLREAKVWDKIEFKIEKLNGKNVRIAINCRGGFGRIRRLSSCHSQMDMSRHLQQLRQKVIGRGY